MLYHLTQDTLAHMLFPLGELTKPQVRVIASEYGFDNASKAESQDICFVPDGDYPSFIERRRDCRFEEGEIVDRQGNVLGIHHGLAAYTIGQRKGIGVAAAEPLYVFAKDTAHNRLVVDVASNVLCHGVLVRDANFIACESIDEPLRCTCKTHYRQSPRACTMVQTDSTSLRITFDEPQRACAPGQAAVAYANDTVICGGTIDSVIA